MKAQPFVISDLHVKTDFVLSLYHKLLELQKIDCSIADAKAHIDSMIRHAARRYYHRVVKPYETKFINPCHFDVTKDGDVVLSVKDKSHIQPETIKNSNRITL
jgi:hypothetical protein